MQLNLKLITITKEILVESPLLHAVNLKTKNPGIVSDEKDKKLIVHRKKNCKT